MDTNTWGFGNVKVYFSSMQNTKTVFCTAMLYMWHKSAITASLVCLYSASALSCFVSHSWKKTSPSTLQVATEIKPHHLPNKAPSFTAIQLFNKQMSTKQETLHLPVLSLYLYLSWYGKQWIKQRGRKYYTHCPRAQMCRLVLLLHVCIQHVHLASWPLARLWSFPMIWKEHFK